MEKSINSLPNRTKEELSVLTQLIQQSVTGCEMIILYGSYSRGEHVFWDERFEFGTHTTFQSDLDILVVIGNVHAGIVERDLKVKIKEKYNKILDSARPRSVGSKVATYASPQFVVEYIGKLNKELEVSQYFFTDIIKDGIVLYDSGNFELAKPRELSYTEIRAIAVKEYGVLFPDANVFLKHAYSDLNDGDYKIGSFEVHQACERYYNAIGLVCSNYKPKTHELEELEAKMKGYSRELVAVFPQNTDFEKRCYDLLCRAYIEARYNPEFVVTKEELTYMLERTEILKEITERVCTEKFKSYDKLIAEQEPTLK